MSFQIAISPNRKAATRFIGKVRRRLQKALADNPDISRSQIADAIGVHRSVITRQLNGRADMSLGRVAEIAWAAGFRAKFELEAIHGDETINWHPTSAPARKGIVVIHGTANAVAEIPHTSDQRISPDRKSATYERVLVGAE